MHLRRLTENFTFKFILVPLLAALVGAIITLSFAPFMEKVRYSYWEKQRKEELKYDVWQKRIDNIASFSTATMNLQVCIDKSIALMQSPNSKGEFSLKEKCLAESNSFWEIGLKATLLFGEEIAQELYGLQESLDILYFKTALSPFRTENYVKDVDDKISKVLGLMQGSITENPWQPDKTQ